MRGLARPMNYSGCKVYIASDSTTWVEVKLGIICSRTNSLRTASFTRAGTRLILRGNEICPGTTLVTYHLSQVSMGYFDILWPEPRIEQVDLVAGENLLCSGEIS